MKRLVPFLAIGLLVAACVDTGDDQLEFGIRRLALDLAFVDEDAAPPPEPEVIVRIVPAPPEVLQPDFDFTTIQVPEPELPPLEPVELCPTAPPEETVELPVSASVIDPPAAGTYLRNNQGTIEILSTGLPITLPYPFISAWTVSEPTEVETVGTLGSLGLEGAPATVQEFTVTKAISPGFEIVETYQVTQEALLLIERITTANGAVTTFRTDPPVEFFHFGAEGDDWVSAGADLDNDFGVLIQGQITDREVIDVCGDLVETFVVNYTEQVVNLSNGETSGTDSSEPSTIYIAPQYGGLVVREEMHTTQRTSVDDTPVVVNFDYVSTLAGIEPT